MFNEEMKKIRLSSRYPGMADFARYASVNRELYREFESGKRIPNKETLERIIQGTCLTKEEATLLREARNEEKGTTERGGLETTWFRQGRHT